ncbi:MAG: hypothetical protein M3Z20_12770 [Chloroflexota bacterium]|nr:hypothetical protein [Chloroflexota bacterium]
MDTDRLSRVLYRLRDATPRRTVLTLLAAGAVGFGLQDPAEARRRKKRKRKKGKRCKYGTERCGETCITGACCAGQVCPDDCQCTRTVEGAEFCKPADERLGLLCMLNHCPPCGANNACPTGFGCIVDASFGTARKCQPPCGFEPRG